MQINLNGIEITCDTLYQEKYNVYRVIGNECILTTLGDLAKLEIEKFPSIIIEHNIQISNGYTYKPLTMCNLEEDESAYEIRNTRSGPMVKIEDRQTNLRIDLRCLYKNSLHYISKADLSIEKIDFCKKALANKILNNGNHSLVKLLDKNILDYNLLVTYSPGKFEVDRLERAGIQNYDAITFYFRRELPVKKNKSIDDWKYRD